MVRAFRSATRFRRLLIRPLDISKEPRSLLLVNHCEPHDESFFSSWVDPHRLRLRRVFWMGAWAACEEEVRPFHT